MLLLCSAFASLLLLASCFLLQRFAYIALLAVTEFIRRSALLSWPARERERGVFKSQTSKYISLSVCLVCTGWVLDAIHLFFGNVRILYVRTQKFLI